MEEEQRPVHREYDLSTGETTEVEFTDEEWAEQKERMLQSQQEEKERMAEDEALREAVRNHDDPVVKALAKRAGMA